MARRTIVSCDRSGREIEGEKSLPVGVDERERELHRPDLRILCPWYPELDQLTFTDLHDEDRKVVANLLARIARRKLGTHYGYNGKPLHLGDDAASVEPVDDSSNELEQVAAEVAASRSDGAAPTSEAVASTDGEPGPEEEPGWVDRPDYVTNAKRVDLGLPNASEDGETRQAGSSWWFALDGRWWGPRTTQTRAQRSVKAILEDRAEHRKRRTE